MSSSLMLVLLSLSLSPVVSVEVHLVHLNDLHARFAPVSFRGATCKSGEQSRCVGGVARIKAFVDDLRESLHHEDRMLFLNAGDLFQGTVWYSMFKWSIVCNLTSSLGFTASSLGNHEFDDGIDDLVSFARSIDHPLLACNLDLSLVPELRELVNCSLIVDLDAKGEQRAAILGYVTPETELLASTGKVIFRDEIESLKAEVERIRQNEANVSLFIALGHSGYEKDLKIAREVSELDVVVGGHTNTFLWSSGARPAGEREPPFGAYPTLVEKGEKRALVVQTSGYGKYLGHLVLRLDEDGLVDFEGGPVLMDAAHPEDEGLRAWVDAYGVEVEEKMAIGVGFTSERIDGSRPRCRLRECDFGNFVTDVMKERMEAQIAVINSGAIKASLPAGNVSMGDVVRCMPWSNTVDLVRLPGSTLLAMLEHSVFDYDALHPDPGGKFLQMSGLLVHFDVSRESGHRVVSALFVDTDDRAEELRPDNIYSVAMLSYMVHGGDGYSMVPETMVEHRNTGFLDNDLIVAHLETSGIVQVPKGGRIVFVDQQQQQAEGQLNNLANDLDMDLEAIQLTLIVLSIFAL